MIKMYNHEQTPQVKIFYKIKKKKKKRKKTKPLILGLTNQAISEKIHEDKTKQNKNYFFSTQKKKIIIIFCTRFCKTYDQKEKIYISVQTK